MSANLTREELEQAWKGLVDKAYSAGLELAGEGHGYEAYKQAFAQLERVSKAISRSFESMYIIPWSGQSNEPAGGERKATVKLKISRGAYFEKLLVIAKGQVFFEEQTTDAGENSPEVVNTERRYTLKENLVFMPGERGPFEVEAEAEKPGFGYNNPLPSTIKFVPQPALNFENTGASISLFTPAIEPNVANSMTSVLTARNLPDVPVPAHIGQYYRFVAGANIGNIARVVLYETPTIVNNLPTNGGKVHFAIEEVLDITGATGIFQVGELLTFTTASVLQGYGIVLANRNGKLAIQRISGNLGTLVTGNTTSHTATVTSTFYSNLPTVEVGTNEWRVLQWVLDVKLTSTNELSPEGGRIGMLDMLGDERNISRAPNESDASYRQRVWAIADVVSPNAIIRTLNKIFAEKEIPFSFREAGQESFQGMFYDAGGSAAGDDTHPPDPFPNPDKNYAYDMDPSLRVEDYWKVPFSLKEFRGYFFIGFKRTNEGEFGMPYDGTTADPVQVFNAYDRSENNSPTAYDGAPIGWARYLQTAYAAINEIKAGGVGFDFILDPEL
jgi:hypothetical protein